LVLSLLLASINAQGVPAITSFSPTAGPPGTSVTIVGSDLGSVLEVRFGTAVAIFSIVSTTRIIATVPLDGTSGPITVGAAAGGSMSAQSFFVAPRITDFSPTNGPPGATVVITGNNFDGATAVQFSGTNANFSVTGPSQIVASVPTGATNGPISVTTPVGTAVSAVQFLVTGNQPFISKITPASGKPGDVILIDGLNFIGVTGVEFNGTNAPNFSVVSPTQLRVTVPAGASTGPISISNALGTGVSSQSFLLTTAPIITDFQPSGGPPGTDVVINGLNFTGATGVRFNGTNAPSFSVTASTQVHATVPPGATPGPINIITPGGVGVSTNIFLAGTAPFITDLSPTNGPPGSIVVIQGINFTGVQSVKFGSVPANFSVPATTQINATVPANATNAPITVTTAGGSATTSSIFLVATGKPLITSFDPAVGLPGTAVTISGIDFTGATLVQFNGANAAFAVAADNQINTIVPANASSGPIKVTTARGSASSASSFIVAPEIASFSPASGIAGTVVTLVGTNLADVTAVQFGNVAAGFTNRSPSVLTAVVPALAVSGTISVTSPAGIVATAVPFVVLPAITRFSPTSGPAGTQVNVFGSGFGGVTGVSFVNTGASFSVVSVTQIVAVVPPQAVSGPLMVATASGIAISPSSFNVGLTANLAVTQTVSTNAVLQGELVTYTVVVTNRGPSAATGLTLADTLPANVQLVSATLSSGVVGSSAGVVSGMIANLPSTGSAQLTLSVIAAVPGPSTNSVSVGANEIDTDLTDNVSTLVTSVAPNPAVLQIAGAAANQVRLSWPLAATNFVLQSAMALGPAASWQAVNVTPVVSGDQKSVTVPNSGGSGFFRLVRP
jgi:uncharacterized repeat protein (TIGR01451 family)